MAAFINNDITAAGLLVLAKGVAGQQINYTKIVLGDGYLEEGQTPRSLTGVVSPKATIDITKCVVNGDGTVTLRCTHVEVETTPVISYICPDCGEEYAADDPP